MAYNTTQAFRSASIDENKTPNLIIDIEGYPYQFAWFRDNKTVRFDDGYKFDEGLFFDTLTPNIDTLPVVSVDGTTKNLTQQLDQDRGTGSTPSMTIRMVDLNGVLTKIFGSDELLGVRANVYLSYAGLQHPDDSVRIFSGSIADVSQKTGAWIFRIDNPDKLKDQTLFVPYTDELTAAIDDTTTTIPVSNTDTIIESGGKLTTYIRIEDELMEVTAITSTSLEVIRGTNAVSHDDEAEVTSVYNLKGEPLELALELMLSGGELEPYYTEIVADINDDNTIILDVFDAQGEKGITVGDTCTIAGSNGGDGDYTVRSISNLEGGLTGFTLVPAITSASFQNNMTAAFTTIYNTLPEGCFMNPDEVDIEQHQSVFGTFGSSFPEIDLFIEDEINAKDLIEKELYLPLGAYFLTRKGRASIGYTAASVALSESVELNSSNIKNPSRITPKRSISKAFYNSVIHKYGYDLLRAKFLKVIISQSEDSINRIRTGRKSLVIEAKGFKNDTNTTGFFNNVSLRLLDRYRFAATTLQLEPTYGAGVTIEVGDSVIFDGSNLNVFDAKSGGTGDFRRVMEVINKDLDITTGNVKVTLLDTNFGAGERFGVVGPSSYLGANSTTSRINIKKGGFTPANDSEFGKWIEHIGSPIKIVSPNFTDFNEVSTITAIDQTNTDYVLIDPPLSSTPLEDYRMELANYDDANDRTKLLYPSIGYSELITSGISSTEFEVADATNLFIDDIVQIHNLDFSNFAKSITILDIVGTTITTTDIGFTPSNGDKIEGGFKSDNGTKYTYF